MKSSEPIHNTENTTNPMRVSVPLVAAGILIVVAVLSRIILSFGTNEVFSSVVSSYTHRFALGFERIFLETIPFLLFGALAAAVVEHWFSSDEISVVYSNRLVPGIIAGLLTGFILPVGEGGSILLARALIKKGAGIPSAVALMLAAPALNILFIAAALGSGESNTVFWLRTGIGVGFAVLFAILVSFEGEPDRLLAPGVLPRQDAVREAPDTSSEKPGGRRSRAIGVSCAREFLEFLPYVIITGLAAAVLQTLLPISWIPPVQGGVEAQIGSAGLWAILSAQGSLGDLMTIQSSATSWPATAQTVFLSLGVLVDAKLLILYSRVLRKKIVLYLAALALATAGLAGLIVGILESGA